MDKRNFYDKLHRQSKNSKIIGSYNILNMNKDKAFNKYLGKIDNHKKFNKELYDKGIEYFNLGGILEETKDEYKNNLSFIKGYEHAKRMAYIQEIEEKDICIKR